MIPSSQHIADDIQSEIIKLFIKEGIKNPQIDSKILKILIEKIMDGVKQGDVSFSTVNGITSPSGPCTGTIQGGKIV